MPGTLAFTNEAKKLSKKPICILSDRCHNRETLTSYVTEKKYQSIVLNSNGLTDNDLLFLCGLTYLEKLSIADTDISGACLSALLSISGLKELNLASNESLDLELTVQNLSIHLPNSQLEVLDLSEIPFNYFALRSLIDVAFQSGQQKFKKLILGDLTHLNNDEIALLYQSIQDFSAFYQYQINVESSSLENYKNALCLNNAPRFFSKM